MASGGWWQTSPKSNLGKDAANRPQLDNALRTCSVHRAGLISKLDGLSRDVAWLLGLETQGYGLVVASTLLPVAPICPSPISANGAQ
jgi:hypothetical protein